MLKEKLREYARTMGYGEEEDLETEWQRDWERRKTSWFLENN
jgi:hypothetical protein